MLQTFLFVLCFMGKEQYMAAALKKPAKPLLKRKSITSKSKTSTSKSGIPVIKVTARSKVLPSSPDPSQVTMVSRSIDPDVGPDWEKSQTRLSFRLKCSLQQVRHYLHRGMPHSPTEGYHVETCRQWVEDFRAAHKLRKSKALPEDVEEIKSHKLELMALKLKAETRKLKQDTRGKKLKNDEYEGLLLPADEVRLWIASRFLRIKQRLELLPDELQMLAPSELRPQLRTDLANAIHSLLLEMSGWQTQATTNEFTSDEDKQ